MTIITCLIYIYLGPPLDLDYYSNLKFDEKELDLDMDNKDPITLAGLFEGDIDGVTEQDIQECIMIRLLNTKLLTIQFLHTISIFYGISI